MGLILYTKCEKNFVFIVDLYCWICYLYDYSSFKLPRDVFIVNKYQGSYLKDCSSKVTLDLSVDRRKKIVLRKLTAIKGFVNFESQSEYHQHDRPCLFCLTIYIEVIPLSITSYLFEMKISV